MSDSMGDKTRTQLEQVQRKEGNQHCADCLKSNPEWAVINVGIFICIDCAGVHRRLGTSVSRVKSVKLDRWTQDMVQNMISTGNNKSKEEYEAKVPSVWPRLNPDAKQLCREEWIRAKYERKEFTPGAPEILRPYLTGLRQGLLYKRKKKSDEWNKRYFILDSENLSYYIYAQDPKPKASIPLRTLNALFDAPGLEQNYSMLITYKVLGRTRSIFVYAESGREIMDWFLAIKCAKLKLLRLDFPDLSENELLDRCTWEFSKTGYLLKMPPTQKKFQKRFFVLDKNNVRYYDKPKDAYPLGEIMLGSTSEGFSVTSIPPEHLTEYTNLFMLHVPYRSLGGFPLLAETDEEKKEWIDVLHSVITGGAFHAPTEEDAVTLYEEEKDFTISLPKALSFSEKRNKDDDD